MERLERGLERFGVPPDERPKFYRTVQDAVALSLREDLYISPPRSEVKRRVDIVVEVILAMRASTPPMSFSKIMSEVHPALRAKLDGRAWSPSSRALYVPASVQFAQGRGSR